MAGKKEAGEVVPAGEKMTGPELNALGELALSVIKAGGPKLGDIEKAHKLLSDVLDRAAELVKPAEKK